MLKDDRLNTLSRYEVALRRQLGQTLKDLRESRADRPSHSQLIPISEP
jgi:hypothetical protein